MASYLDSLLDRIEDEQLRSHLIREVRGLRNRKDFGLVFERHLPETVRLYGHEVNIGTTVQERGDVDGPLWRVRKISGEKATVERRREAEIVTEVFPTDDLVVVRQFGSPIYPGLTSLGRIENGGEDGPWHAVIEAENYHALETLAYTHGRSVDCIYIDPPYNTGARDWKYNNDYVDATDVWHHSKWLSMMEKRLRIAKLLLKPDGVLICTIDEHEVHHLGMLLEQTFPEYLRYMVTIVINPKGTRKANFGRVDEYAFFIVPDLGHDVIAQLPPPDDQKEADLAVASEDRSGDEEGVWVREISESGVLTVPAGLRERLGLGGGEGQLELTLADDGTVELQALPGDGTDEHDEDAEDAQSPDSFSVLFLRRRGAQSSFRYQRPNQFYAIKVNETTGEVVGVGPLLDAHEPYELGYREGDVLWVYPIDGDGHERVWRYVRATMADYIKAGEIRTGKRWDDKPQTYTLNHHKPRGGERQQRVRTTWWRTAHDAGTHGTTLISRLLGTQSPFPFPKSLYAVRDCLEVVVKDRPDAVIVDYFAGSGTTLHATALLNRQDGGRRQCVLVTNNEVDETTAQKLNAAGHFEGDPHFDGHGIFAAATRPRIETAFTGVRPDGSPVPTAKGYRYLDGRPWSEGFAENVEFFRLDYLGRDDVSLGRAFEAVAPLLWLKAGGVGPRIEQITQPWALPTDAVYGVLFDPQHWALFVQAVADRGDAVRNAFIVTDSTSVFQQVIAELPPWVTTTMLYEDYLSTFAINAGPSS